LSGLREASVGVLPGDGYPEPGQASVKLLFANGTWLRAEYWRLVIDGRAGISSFDHQQKYGLPAPIDAVQSLREILQDKLVTNAFLDHKPATCFLSLEALRFKYSTSPAMRFGKSTFRTELANTPTTLGERVRPLSVLLPSLDVCSQLVVQNEIPEGLAVAKVGSTLLRFEFGNPLWN
jgi:hypothetical protein